MLRLFAQYREKTSFILIELVLIIAGVLAAIAVENWRESMQEGKLEQGYLFSLRNAVQADTAMFAMEIQKCFQKQKAAERLLQLMDKPEPIGPEEMEQLVERVIMGIDPFYTTVVFEDLRSTGRLQLLRDEGLRTSIIEYYLAAEHLTQIHSQNRDALAYNSRFTGVLTFEEYTLALVDPQKLLPRLAKSDDARHYLAELQKNAYTAYSSMLFISLPSSLTLLEKLETALGER
jgi:hypothetical protein